MSKVLHGADHMWRDALREVLHFGARVGPASEGGAWKGSLTRELIAYRSVWPMGLPVITAPERKLGYKFMVAEAAWILSGCNDVATIAPFSKKIKDFSDDGVRFFGAYGPKFIQQLSYAVQALRADLASRQAVINIWRENPPKTKDVPCTLSWQFLVRDGQLDCVATMRSSDLWHGIPYDTFTFSMAAAVVLLELRATLGVTQEAADLHLGNLYLTAGSQHIYERDVAEVDRVLDAASPVREIRPLDLSEFSSAAELIGHLNTLARTGWAKKRFLRELFPPPVHAGADPLGAQPAVMTEIK